MRLEWKASLTSNRNDPVSDVCISATKLFMRLDRYMDEGRDRQSLDSPSETAGRKQQKEDCIEGSLRCAIRCFTSRWFPLASQGDGLATGQVEEMVRESWRAARKDMLKVINRISYRSILTLYLFAQTPIPVGISEEEELDGISGSLCIQTALTQLQVLRERTKGCPLNQSDGTRWPASSRGAVLTQEFLNLESRAYWAAVTWDTSSSLTFDLKTSLTSGLKGACSEPAWRLARSFLVGSFHTETEHWRMTGFEVTDAKAFKIHAAAAVSSFYIGKNIASLKEALREGVDEESVLFAYRALLDAIGIFKTSVRPLLDKCEKRIHFLDQVCRLSWYKVSLQYCLGILVLVDALEAADRPDLLLGVMEARQDAESEFFNVLNFGLVSRYTICRTANNAEPGSIDIPGQRITTSLIAIDPSSQYVVESILLMSKIIGQKYRQNNIKQETYSYLASILFDALKQLPQSCRSVLSARESIQLSLHPFDSTCITCTIGTTTW